MLTLFSVLIKYRGSAKHILLTKGFRKFFCLPVGFRVEKKV